MNWGLLAIWSGALAVGLAVLIKAADVFLLEAERVGLHFGLPRFVIGVTIIAFGTSFPELVTAVASVLLGAGDIAAGTVIGSNVTNILLILGAAALLGGGMRVEHDVMRVDLPFLFGSALMVLLMGFDGRMRWLEGILCLGALAAYISYAAHSRGMRFATLETPGVEEVDRSTLPPRVWLLIVASAAFLQAGAWLTVEAVMRLADLVQVGEEILSASIVAVGTSLPELVVSARAARAGNPEGAIGNVIGSNIFNSVGVLGAAALFGTVVFPASLVTFALPAMIGATVLCFFVVQDRDVTPWDGWLLLILFFGFQFQLFRAF